VIAAAVLIAGVVLGPGMLLRHHPLLPGVAGCRYLADTAARSDCMASRTAAAVRADGVRPALRATQAAADASPSLLAECHEAMHAAAEAAAGNRRARASWTTVSLSLDGTCADGFAHGLLSQAVRRGPETEIAATITYCSRPGISSLEQANCLHGVGHGLHQRGGLDRSLDWCRDRTLVGGGSAGNDCMSGAFMQETMDHPPGAAPRELLALCRGVTSAGEADVCFSYVAGAAEEAGLELEAIADVCLAAGSEAAVRSCGSGLGEMVLPDARPGCAGLDERIYEWCQTGYAGANVAARQLTARDLATGCGEIRQARQETCARVTGLVTGSSLAPDEDRLTSCARLFGEADSLRQACTAGRQRSHELERKPT
jgi:hypothetical protein